MWYETFSGLAFRCSNKFNYIHWKKKCSVGTTMQKVPLYGINIRDRDEGGNYSKTDKKSQG